MDLKHRGTHAVFPPAFWGHTAPVSACHDCRCCEKSSFRAIDRPPRSSDDSLRLSLFGGFALTPGPEPFISTLPSISSRGAVGLAFMTGFGSFDGWEGFGDAKKY